MTAYFTGSLVLDFGDWGPDVGRIAITKAPIGWYNGMLVVLIPVGTMSDGATVPRILWAFLPQWGDRATMAAILHDYLCEMVDNHTPVAGCETRSKCDAQFYHACIASGVEEWRARAAWLGVRAYSLTHGYFT